MGFWRRSAEVISGLGGGTVSSRAGTWGWVVVVRGGWMEGEWKRDEVQLGMLGSWGLSFDFAKQLGG